MIIKEIKKSNEQDKSMPAKQLIYYELIIFFIIGLDIVSGVFRFLGCIFMLTLVKIIYKMKISKFYFNELIFKRFKFYLNKITIIFFLVEETLSTYEIFPNSKKSLTKKLLESNTSSSTNNINNNFYFNNFTDLNTKFNINNNSFISTKNNPNEFETFNFDNRKSFLRGSMINDKYNNNIFHNNYSNNCDNIKENLVEKEMKSNSTNIQETNKIQSEDKNESNKKIFGFSFSNSKLNEFPCNKSLINFPLEENKYINILNKDTEINYNDDLNVEYLQSMMMRDNYYNNDTPYANNNANTYDSNYGKL